MSAAVAHRASPHLSHPASSTSSPMDSKKNTLKAEGTYRYFPLNFPFLCFSLVSWWFGTRCTPVSRVWWFQLPPFWSGARHRSPATLSSVLAAFGMTSQLLLSIGVPLSIRMAI